MDVLAWQEMLAAAYWAIADRIMRKRPPLDEQFRVEAIDFCAHRGRVVGVMIALLPMNVVVLVRDGTSQPSERRKSNLRLRVRSGCIESVSEIAPLDAIARCLLLGAILAREDMASAARAIVKVAVPAKMWPDNRPVSHRNHAAHLSSIDRRHLLHEMVGERCA